MAQAYNINEVSSIDEISSIKHETERAKLYLQTFCPEVADNLYDHLSKVLSKILMERPKNAFASFEEYSKKLQNDKFSALNNNLCDLYVPPPSSAKNAKKLLNLFKVYVSPNEELRSLEESIEYTNKIKSEIPNMFDLLYFFESSDIGLPRAELVFLNLSIRKLIAAEKIEDVRFWGKILGRPKNYYIVEASLSENELERRLEELKNKEQSLEGKSENMDVKEVEEEEQEDIEVKALETAMVTKLSYKKEEDLKFVFPPIPKNTWEPLPEVSEEKLGTGTNAKVYFVCNSPGLDNWVELPSVTPQQIVVARQTVHLFTGNLESSIHTFPPFPGSEKNYLRAQIARIGAATHVSPIGYFRFGNDTEDEEEEDEEEEEEKEEVNDDEEEESEVKDKSKIVKNWDYNPLPLADLIDPSMSNWCHHSPYILKQGRVIWQDPTKAQHEDEESDEGEEEGEDEEEESNSEEEYEESEKDNAFTKEISPPLLTPLSEDSASEFTTPWTVRQSSEIQPDTAVALIRSNIWPGAFAVAADKKFANLYVGWGHKHNAYNYNPPSMPDIQEQYVIDSELVEIQDPSFEEEEAYRIAHLPPVPETGEAEEEGDAAEVDSTENDEED